MDVSIIICTRNRAGQLRRALAALGAIETRRQWEAVIIDNGSTDETASVIREASERCPHIRYHSESEVGLGAARDTGWRISKGDILSFTDDDCYVARDYVDAVYDAFLDRPEAGFLGGRITLFDPSDAPVTIDLRDQPAEIPSGIFVTAGAIQGANLSFRRVTLERIGGFDRRLGAGTAFPCEDIDVVAAAVWAGISGGYDPRPVVAHHHGRTATDIPALNESYDRGRGAYYMKYLMRSDTRRFYIRGWVRQAQSGSFRYAITRLDNELSSALRYYRGNKGQLSIGLLTFLNAARLFVVVGGYLSRYLKRQ